MTALSTSLQAWFTDRLIRERNASPHTVASYRDTIRLLLTFASQRLKVEPSRLELGQLDAPLIGAFLDHLETDRGCGPRTRNTRLAAIRTFYRYCLLRHPEYAATIERVLQIGPKRHERALVTYLTELELDALIDAPDRTRWTGRRDHAIINLLAQTGLRASELTGLCCGDIHLGAGAHVATTGKGRKQRITPLTRGTVSLLRVWLAERAGRPDEPLFPTSTGKPLTRKALAPSHRQARRHCRAAVPVADGQDDHAARPAPHRRDALAARRRRHHRDRSVARPRASRNHADVPARRPRDQRTRAGAHQATGQQARPLPPDRRAPRIPGRTVSGVAAHSRGAGPTVARLAITRTTLRAAPPAFTLVPVCREIARLCRAPRRLRSLLGSLTEHSPNEEVA
jgi:integrase/recombinase XerD